MAEQRNNLKLVVAGHVDHGKSTIIGRLLADTHSLPDGKLEAVKENCRRNSKPFEYAFLLDALKEEQAQGVTIDAARIFFHTKKRNYLIIDAPGHIEFLKNMITGASWAEAALLVIDACEGVKENSRRHGYMISFLGIKQICVLVNKMDLVNYDEAVFNKITKEYTDFLEKLNVGVIGFIPVSGMEGDNIASSSKKMDWYKGPTLLKQLDNFLEEQPPDDKHFRMPVQDVYKFTEKFDNRRIVAGQIESGKLTIGDDVVFYPSGKSSKVKSFESLDIKNKIESKDAGWSVGFTLDEQIFVKRGEIACIKSESKPLVSSLIRTRLFWLGKNHLDTQKNYLFKLGTSKLSMSIAKIERIMDASTLESKESDVVNRNEIADCIIRLEKPIAFDLATDFPSTGRFVVVDNFEISGGGLILNSIGDENSWILENVIKRNEKWEPIAISEEMRAERYNQKACMLLITGSPTDNLRKIISKNLTEYLFDHGKFVYFIGMANLLYGIDADIRGIGEDVRPEHMRRLGEIGNMMMHAGMILVVSAQEITDQDVNALRLALSGREDRLITVWAGDSITTNLNPDLWFKSNEMEMTNGTIEDFLKEKGYIFKFNGS
jgi:bifunctional enzyme CysN/CysC